jgi:[protein-PII] uridylyltransferase
VSADPDIGQPALLIDDRALDGLSAKEQAAILRPLLDEARARVAAQHEAGAPGDETTAAWAAACDAAVIALFRAAGRAHPSAAGVSLVAAGGYGRAELFPYSDLDLWFVLPKGGRVDADSRALAEAVLYPLWDLKLEVGHAVRSPEETLALARDDLSAATALLDLRFLDGDRAPYEALVADIPRAIGETNAFIARLKQEKEDRHARFGDTVFLLEPNVKNGEGGYRDLLVGLWAVKARYRVKRFSDLPGIGAVSHRPVEALAAAHQFLLEVRTSAHLAAKRKADRLTFELQESIAPAWVARTASRPRVAVGALASVPVPPELHVEPAVAPAVEALMQEYFIHAKAVRRETDRLLERCRVEPARKPSIRRLDDSFALFNGKLSTHGPDVFRERPSEMVRLFNVALETGAEIYGHTRDLVADTVASMSDRLAEDPKAGEELLKLLLDDRDQGAPSLLEQVHDLGLLAAVMPEFAPCTGRVQHDLYHVFTVDQHQLYAVGRLKELARGELSEELPVATAAMKEVRRRAPLYLGTLLHDVGKPLGKGHSETGARLAVIIAKRLGLSEEDAAQTEFLVRKHLLLSHLSQRRDLNDVAMIANLADELKDDETLRELYLLTVADMSMVAPGNLTTWKEQLLTELYQRTMSHLAPASPEAAPTSEESEAELIARRKARVAELLGESERALASWFATVPDRYIVLTAPKQIARHVALTRRRRGPVATEVVHRARRGSSELTVVADDAPGLLAKIAGVLVAHRVDVLSATITSRQLPGDGATPARAEAVDVFVTRDRYGRPITDEKRWAKVEEDLGRVLSGQVPVERVIEERRERGGLPERVVPAVATEIEVDNQVSAEFSVVDVFTQDRPGVLYAITKTLAALELDIHLSKVATEAARVADVFYVREAAGGGKLSPARIEEVKQALEGALASLRDR